MDTHQCRGFGTDGGGVVGKASAIRRSNLLQLDARLPEDIWQTKRATDLDELTTTNDDPLAGRQRLQHKECGGGAVVYNKCGLRPGDFLTKSIDGSAAPAAPTGRHVDFQVGA